MNNGLVTFDGTKVLTVAEYDRFVNFISMKFRPIFEVNTITGLWYVDTAPNYLKTFTCSWFILKFSGISP